MAVPQRRLNKLKCRKLLFDGAQTFQALWETQEIKDSAKEYVILGGNYSKLILLEILCAGYL